MCLVWDFKLCLVTFVLNIIVCVMDDGSFIVSVNYCGSVLFSTSLQSSHFCKLSGRRTLMVSF